MRRRSHDPRSEPSRPLTPLAFAISAVLAGVPLAHGQGAVELESVIVTAQKRTENLQDVPVSIQALGTQRLEELRVADFDDFARFLPSLSYTTFGPGFSRVFFRGVSSGDNGNHSGSQPTVGQYLDEQPITTITGALDLHIYDIARVESLAGPQGTLYGASSQAGTIRLITNKPDSDRFEAGYDLEGSLSEGEGGYIAEGFVNAPLSENTAIRLVGWSKRDPGFISNVNRVRNYPEATIAAGRPIQAVNDDLAEENYNAVDTYGARAALRIDLNDRWAVTPTIMTQNQEAKGAFAYAPSIGDLEVARYRPESSRDRFTQAALTVEGKIGNLDLVYAGSYLERDVDTQSDYSDYSYFYDVLYQYFAYNDDGDIIEPTQYIRGKDRYERHSHEIRLSSPSDQRVRFVTGLFFQRQQHGIEQRYMIDDLIADYEVTGWADTIWLTEQERVDRDYAVFGEVTWDLTEKLSATVGARFFKAKNSLEGFYGYSDEFSGSGTNGETRCSQLAQDPRFDTSSWVPYTSIGTAPCKNLDKSVDEEDYTPKVNLQYRIDDSRMVYITWSEGFRPGGVNRRGDFPAYEADFLTNYEIGWKTSWMGNRLRFNGAAFWLDWDDFQYSFTGENGLTNITNAGGAQIRGIETDFDWLATDALLLSGSFSVLDPELTEDFCQTLDDDTGEPLSSAACIALEDGANFAAEGTELPLIPRYKANLTARYSFPIGGFDGHVQGSVSYQDGTRSALLPFDEAVLGTNGSYSLTDLSAGIRSDAYSVELFVNNAFDERADIARFVQCRPAICSNPYIITNQPRTFGIKFGQRF